LTPILIAASVAVIVAILLIGVVRQFWPRHAGGTDGAMVAEFDRVSYYKTDEMRAFTYCVSKPNKRDIEAYCENYRTRYGLRSPLRIHFFDTREAAPDITWTYEIPESSKPFLIAEYASEPTNKGELKFLKDVPEAP
jgi:hypothetical protein